MKALVAVAAGAVIFASGFYVGNESAGPEPKTKAEIRHAKCINMPKVDREISELTGEC
jgi:hypothetical protein